MGLLAPLFIAGFALLVVPWIVHQIRRPEREVQRFSSLMFVPNVRREVIQRQKIQHPWLMLMRMILLALLAFAFARPYWQTPAAAASADGVAARHVILLDASYSMRTADRFDRARRRALDLLDNLPAADRVGVVAFDSAPSVLAPLDDPADADADVGTVARARRALAELRPGWRATAYLPALEKAESLLAPADPDDDKPPTRFIVHLITDFQHAGMPTQAPAWRLSPLVELDAIDVSSDETPVPVNRALTDLVVDRTAPETLRVRAKIKNFNDTSDAPVRVQRIAAADAAAANAAEPESRDIHIERGNATQVQFTFPVSGARAEIGRLQLAPDALDGDNAFYYAWNPRDKTRVWLVADFAPDDGRAATRLSTARLLRLVVPDEPALPWSLTPHTNDDLLPLAAASPDAPHVVILADPESLGDDAARALLAFCRRGGRALLLLDTRVDPARFNASPLGQLGMTCEGPRYAATRESVFATLGWIDLSHRVFLPFRDARYNDFSAIRFFNHQRLSLPDADSPVRVVARFEDDLPAIVEAPVGDGKILLWTFGLDLDSTNLPKKGAFVPLLHETLAHLSPPAERSGAYYLVGDTAVLPPALAGDAGPWRVALPGGEDWTDLKPPRPAPIDLAQPGLLRWRTASRPEWEHVDAVNVDARESDPLRIAIPEFRIRLCSAGADPAPAADPSPAASAAAAAGEALVTHEYGLWIVGVLLAFLLVESVYALRLASSSDDEKGIVT
jgi:hypothetical protein